MTSENLSMTSTILLSGNTLQRIKETVDIANVTFFSDSTCDCLRNQYVFPAVNNKYNAHKGSIILRFREEESLGLLVRELRFPRIFCKVWNIHTYEQQICKNLDFNVKLLKSEILQEWI